MLDILTACILMVLYAMVGLLQMIAMFILPLAIVSLIIFLIGKRD